MANQQNIAKKAEQATIVKDKITAASSVVVVDYRGYTVSEVTELRNQMREAGVEYVVLKNGIVERAAQQADLGDDFLALLKGPSAFAFGNEDAVAPARILKDFIKKTKKGEFKGGLIEGHFADVKELEKIADLPSRDVLIAKILGSINSPIAKLAIAINQIREKAESGVDLSTLSAPVAEEAPAEAVEAPVAEAAPAEAPAEEASAANEAPEAEAPAEEAPAAEDAPAE